jgi:hypothetical protein
MDLLPSYPWALASRLDKSRCEKPSQPPGMHSSTQHACQAANSSTPWCAATMEELTWISSHCREG